MMKNNILFFLMVQGNIQSNMYIRLQLCVTQIISILPKFDFGKGAGSDEMPAIFARGYDAELHSLFHNILPVT